MELLREVLEIYEASTPVKGRGDTEAIPPADLIKRGKKAYKAFNKFIDQLRKTDPKNWAFDINDGDDAQEEEMLFDPASKSFFISFTIEWAHGDTGATNWFEIDPLGKVTMIKSNKVPKKVEELELSDIINESLDERDLLELQLTENAKTDERYEKLKAALETKEQELFALLDKMRDAVESGEFDLAVHDARDFVSAATKTNDLANKLADVG